ncbi:MAG: hypothetical protein K6A71_00290 [Lachnospiraceae bacterium]|nr:hypothetical protein [Lachnospiraceae bacterium]
MREGLVLPGAPGRCGECGGKLNYRGLGEYACEDCGNLEYDDYGKVRSYLEQHPGALQGEVSKATGVPANRIRGLLEQERIEISAGSGMFLHCEICGEKIRSGIRCPKCEALYKKEIEAQKRNARSKPDISGHSMNKEKGTGEMRFLKK